MTDFRGREITSTEGTTSQSIRRESSRERSASREHKMLQDLERREISAIIDHSKMHPAPHDIPSKQQLEEIKYDQELLSLKQEVLDRQNKIADREKYDYERANVNFEARYETDPPMKAGEWVLVNSKVKIPVEVRKTLTERKRFVDFKNNFNLKRGFIDIEEV